MPSRLIINVVVLLSACSIRAAGPPHKSPHALLRSATMEEAAWTEGFWADRCRRARTATIPAVEAGLSHKDNSEQLDVLRIAAGLKKGDRQSKGRPWTDGDCYKWIEAMARQFQITRDPDLDRKMDDWIGIIQKAQSPDGYLSTNFWDKPAERLKMPYFHEMYNMGHLLTAASVHYRATGKTTFLAVARKNADFLYRQFSPRPPRLVHFPWNPSAHMGLIDLYRVTGEAKYLALARILIGNRGSSPGGGTHRNGGTDQTQDRVPIRKADHAVGHAVCATYLYCGATDLYAETGDMELIAAMKRLWMDVTTKRMFITGGVGSGAGRSIRGDPVHEAFMDDYQLPNDCYSETCANIGHAMWQQRLMNVTGDATFADGMERVIYNAGLSPVSIAQDRFFYCNPLVWHGDKKLPHKHHTASRWLIHDCYCCPPQMARTLSALQTWAYSIGGNGIWVNLYGGSKLKVRLPAGVVELTQKTRYPWNGKIRIQVKQCPKDAFSLHLRIPGWTEGVSAPWGPSIKINGTPASIPVKSGTYVQLKRTWKAGDTVRLSLPMYVRLMAAHPKIVNNRDKIAVMRGPLVYCVEQPLSENGKAIWQKGIYFPENIIFTPRFDPDLLGGVVVLEGKALTETGKIEFIRGTLSLLGQTPPDNIHWEGNLYHPFEGRALPVPKTETVQVSLIPYYAWANRGVSYMQVWTPMAR